VEENLDDAEEDLDEEEGLDAEEDFQSVKEQLEHRGSPNEWFFTFSNEREEIECFQVFKQSSSSALYFSRRVVVKNDLSWQVYAGKHLVSMNNSILSSYSFTASYTVLKGLMQDVGMATLCCGNFEAEFIEVAHL